MKRSEMIKNIHKFIDDLENTDEDYMIIDTRLFCDNLLDMIEERMLPPKHPTAPRCITTNGFAWELEDDEQLVNV